MEATLDRVRRGEADPPCELCGGILKSATVSFGQALREVDLARADAAAGLCDLMLAVGTTLSVYPIAGVVPRARSSGARVVVVNDSPTDMDHVVDLVLRGRIGEILPRLVREGPA